MNYAAIDVGSNSVRLLLNGKKYLEITTLGEGLLTTGRLKKEAIDRTLDAIETFYHRAEEEGADEVFVFATQAVRSAVNGHELVEAAAEKGIHIDVIPKEKEAELGFLGAYKGGLCATLDIGGASSEIAVGDENGIIYKGSIAVGAVSLKDVSDDRTEEENFVREEAKGYGDVPPFDTLIAIGGTPTTYAAIHHDLEVYDPEIVDGTLLTVSEVREITDRIESTPYEERRLIRGLHPKKVPYALTSGVLLYTLSDVLNKSELTVSEADNLEGYIIYKTR